MFFYIWLKKESSYYDNYVVSNTTCEICYPSVSYWWYTVCPGSSDTPEKIFNIFA